jgi:hypothetical protein
MTFLVHPVRLIAMIMVLGCAACQAGGPHLTGANSTNIGAMVANPMDLVIGEDAPGSDAQEAAAAVARLRQDRVRPLETESLVGLGGGGGGASSGGP